MVFGQSDQSGDKQAVSESEWEDFRLLLQPLTVHREKKPNQIPEPSAGSVDMIITMGSWFLSPALHTPDSQQPREVLGGRSISVLSSQVI